MILFVNITRDGVVVVLYVVVLLCIVGVACVYQAPSPPHGSDKGTVGR